MVDADVELHQSKCGALQAEIVSKMNTVKIFFLDPFMPREKLFDSNNVLIN